MDFSYVVVDQEGKKQKGTIEATSQKEVLDYLRTNNLIPIQIGVKQRSSLHRFNKVKNSDIVLFTRQLSSMVLTGLTLVESLSILKKQTTKPQLRQVIDDLISEISEGKSFSQALSNHKDIFSDVYIALIKAAETGGLLDKILARLADNLEKSEDLKKRVRSAMFYPAIIISGVVLVIGIMNIFVIPQLGELYANLNLELPATTRIVLGFSDIVKKTYPFIIGGFIGMIFLLKRLKKTDTGLRTIDKLKLRIPVIGSILRLSILDEITRTLSLLISSGTSILEALNITSDVSNNIWYKDAVKESSVLVEKGVSLSTAFEHQNIFPSILIQMTKVGEATGKIDEGLVKLAEYFERDLDLKVKTLTTSIEPILIIVLGVAVAFLIISVITPIYGLISQIQ